MTNCLHICSYLKQETLFARYTNYTTMMQHDATFPRPYLEHETALRVDIYMHYI